MRREINVRTGEITEHLDASTTPEIPPTAAEILVEKQTRYDTVMNNPVYIALIDAISDAITAGNPIDAATLRANGRGKIK